MFVYFCMAKFRWLLNVLLTQRFQTYANGQLQPATLLCFRFKLHKRAESLRRYVVTDFSFCSFNFSANQRPSDNKALLFSFSIARFCASSTNAIFCCSSAAINWLFFGCQYCCHFLILGYFYQFHLAFLYQSPDEH